MRHCNLLLGRVCLLGILAAAAPAAKAQLDVAIQEFDRGNQLYLAGDFTQAVQAYEFALTRGFASAELHYNLANAYFRTDKVGQAIRHYEKALAIDNALPEVAHNLEIARERRTDRFSYLPRPGWARVIGIIVERVSPTVPFVIGLLVYVAGIVVACLSLLRVLRWGPTLRTGAWSAVVGVVLVAAGLGISIEREANQRAIIVVDEVELWESPAGGAEPLARLHEGLDVDVVSRDSAWVEVRLPNGRSGWLRKRALGDI